MKVTAISESLETQAQNLRNFLMIIKSKQDALIKRDLEELTISMESEEKFITKIDKEEEYRISLINGFLKQNEIENNTELLKLPNFIAEFENRIDDDDLELIKDRQETVKELTSKVITVNNQNKHLIENAKSLIREIITTAVGDKKHSIIDRRI